MSNKTLKQRIALVAASALTAGFLSVVAMPAANAAAITVETMTVYANATTGAVGALNAAPDTTNGNSSGLLIQSDTGNTIGGASQLTQTATMTVAGVLSVAVDSASYATIAVTGGTITASGGSSDTTVISAGRTSAYNTTNTGSLSVTVTPNGVGTMVVNAYAGAAAATPTTNFARVTVTVVATGAAYNAVSAADSTVYWGTAATTTSDTSTTDVSSSNYSKADAAVIRGSLDLYDVYGNAVTSSTGLITCSVTGGAVCNLDNSATPAAGTAATDFSTHTQSNIYFSVAQGTAGVAAVGTMSIKYNDTVLATKSFTISGTVAKITVASVNIGRTGDTSAANFTVSLADAAGNAVYASSGISVDPLTTNEAVTAVAITTYPSSSTAISAGTFTCSGTAGYGTTVNSATATPRLRMLNAAGTYVYSDKFTAKCGGDAKAFTASLDKASYTPGSVATLTLAFTDTKGNKPNDFYTLTAGDATGDAAQVVTYVGSPGTVVTASALGDKPTDGVKTYQFIVGSTEGDFSMVVDAPYVRAQSLALGGSQGKITLSYSIKSGSSTVTNAEVLKSIVALIASINKQIQALQKLILKR